MCPLARSNVSKCNAPSSASCDALCLPPLPCSLPRWWRHGFPAGCPGLAQPVPDHCGVPASCGSVIVKFNGVGPQCSLEYEWSGAPRPILSCFSLPWEKPSSWTAFPMIAKANRGVRDEYISPRYSETLFTSPSINYIRQTLVRIWNHFYGDNWSGLFEAITGYGLGGSSIALFGRVGGGIYTK
eukprot:scaffold156826_cov18-Tisochrysis_lutea.AAC.1